MTRHAKHDDGQLIRAYVAEGDERAFQELYKRHHSELLAFARRKICDQTAADDLVSDMWTQVAKHVHRFDASRGTFKNWCYTILHNRIKNWYRHQSRGPGMRRFSELQARRGNAVNHRAIQFEDPAADASGRERTERFRAQLEKAMADLPARLRAALQLVDVEDQSYRQAADALDVPLGTLKSRLSRGRSRVEEELRGKDVAPKTAA